MKKYLLSEIEQVLKQEEIGRHSRKYVLERLDNLDDRGTEINIAPPTIKTELKNKPSFDGVLVTPSSVNNVSFKHNDENICLHFLSNGNIALTKESNKKEYLEIDKNQLCELILSKF